MRGRTPKDPDQRRRRNKASTAAVLPSTPAKTKAPELPKDLFAGGVIAPRTSKWWATIWRSPMASRWLEADVEGLYLVAVLRNEFYQRPSPTLAAEIRQQEARFGLTPIDRRRLDWRIEGPKSEPDQAPKPAASSPTRKSTKAPAPFADPRDVLRAVK